MMVLLSATRVFEYGLDCSRTRRHGPDEDDDN